MQHFSFIKIESLTNQNTTLVSEKEQMKEQTELNADELRYTYYDTWMIIAQTGNR